VHSGRPTWETEDREITMDREYDIFEVHPNGDLFWQGCVAGLENARLKVVELGKKSSNHIFATHTPTKEIVAQANHNRAKTQRAGEI
jgi:hypothetical protein